MSEHVRVKESTTIVIADSLRRFWQEFDERFPRAECIKLRQQGRVVFNNGRRIIYISGPDRIRGFHSVNVETWGPPPRWVNAEFEHLMQIARMP